MSYELFYSTGGHSGPYPNVFEAKMVALRLLAGNKDEKWIDIKTRDFGNPIARITRDNYYMVADELGKTVPPTTSVNNVAIFTVEARVILAGVSDSELNNSEVLHPDVLERLKQDLAKVTITNVEITLDEVYEVKDGNMKKWR